MPRATRGIMLLLLCSSAVYGLEKGRDPTRPLVGVPTIGEGEKGEGKEGEEAGPKAVVLVLSAIVEGEDRKIAVINGQVVEEGETVAGSIVSSISSNSVLVLGEAGEEVIQLLQHDVKGDDEQ